MLGTLNSRCTELGAAARIQEENLAGGRISLLAATVQTGMNIPAGLQFKAHLPSFGCAGESCSNNLLLIWLLPLGQDGIPVQQVLVG